MLIEKCGMIYIYIYIYIFPVFLESLVFKLNFSYQMSLTELLPFSERTLAADRRRSVESSHREFFTNTPKVPISCLNRNSL
jgi:hypothetical protein